MGETEGESAAGAGRRASDRRGEEGRRWRQKRGREEERRASRNWGAGSMEAEDSSGRGEGMWKGKAVEATGGWEAGGRRRGRGRKENGGKGTRRADARREETLSLAVLERCMKKELKVQGRECAAILLAVLTVSPKMEYLPRPHTSGPAAARLRVRAVECQSEPSRDGC
eukprot:2611589-Rhodomonas_salina.1